MEVHGLEFISFSPSQRIAIGYLSIAIIGSILLSLPWSRHIGVITVLMQIGGAGMTLITTSILIDLALEPHIRIMRNIFEEVSSFGTVGLSTGITGIVHTPVKWVLIVTMYIGRVGILTLFPPQKRLWKAIGSFRAMLKHSIK